MPTVEVPLNTCLADLDEALRKLIKRELDRHGFEGVEIAFDAPASDWSARSFWSPEPLSAGSASARQARFARVPRGYVKPLWDPGIPVTELSADQKEGLQKVLMSLVEPYRPEDRDEVLACLKAQGGLEACSLAFYQDGDIGDDGEWDNWRLEGPSFVWYFRGHPHVHIWINVADDPAVKLNARG